MSGATTTTNTTASGTPLSSLSIIDTPASADLIFGIFGGKAQLVPQSTVWNGALPTAGGTVTGAVSATYQPTDPSHLVPKSYVDGMGDKIASSVTGAVGTQVTAAQAAAQTAQDAATNANNAASGAANAATLAVSAQKGANGGVAPLDANGTLVLNSASVMSYNTETGTLTLHVSNLAITGDLPTTDPQIKGQWWNNGGTIYISQGPAS
ncbi:hypothetical protein ACWM9A_10535 [Acetobacter pasteurianus]